MIDLRDAVNKNENPGKIVAIVEKIFEFDKKKTERQRTENINY